MEAPGHLPRPRRPLRPEPDIIERREAQTATKLPNLPKAPATHAAFSSLAIQVIDPVIDYFGEAKLTYGFCSRELANHIPDRVDPSRDQHAAHELNTRGKPICPRLGAAADFLVPYESMLEVAQWRGRGDHRPIRVSVGPENTRQIVWMKPGKGGRRVPAVVEAERFLRLSPADLRQGGAGAFGRGRAL